jgi:SRSO17 transposase
VFVSYNKPVLDKAQQYLYGLVHPGIRKNMEVIADRIDGAEHQSIQQFISDSRWSAQAAMDRTAQEADAAIGDPHDAALLLDESGFEKKGDKSVGVARQWLGRLGKVDNGQVGVFAALARGCDVALVNGRLYLPQVWIGDPDRCLKAHVPQEYISFQTKDEIALQMVVHGRELGMRFGWVGADAGYGKGIGFLRSLHTMGETFMVDIHSDFQMYDNNPKPYIPTGGKRGRQPTLYVSDKEPTRVDTWVKGQSDAEWSVVEIRDGAKGILRREALSKRVWIWEEGTQQAYQWHLLVTRDPQTHSDHKYSFSNAAAETSLQRLTFMQSQRYWIERAFEDAKGECGMADYEVRGWDGWHHHMALVMMAQLFLLNERRRNRDEVPILTCADVVKLLVTFLPRKQRTYKEVLKEIQRCHNKRLAAMESARKRQLANDKIIVT